MPSTFAITTWCRRLLPTMTMLLALATPATAQTCGDADGSGSITVTDGVRVLRAAAGLGDCELARCDADGSGAVTVTDGVNVLRAAAGLGDPTGCSGGGSLGPRRTFLRDLTTVIALPGYRTLASAAVEMEAAIETLVNAPGTEALGVAQEAWRATRRAWKQTEAFRIGPSETQRTSARIDWPSANPTQIDGEIAGSAVLSSAYLDNLGAQKVGFQAIEYFIFDPLGGDAGAVGGLQGPGNARRRDYLRALAVNVRERTVELRDAWEPSGGNFGADLVDSGIGGTTFPTLKEAFDEVVNRMIFTAEVVEENRLGQPLGIKTGGSPRPDLVESPRSGDGLPGVLANLQGIANVYRGSFQGGQGTGIGTQVLPLSAEIDADVRQLLDDAIAAVQAVPSPLGDAIVNHHDEVQAAYEAVQSLRRALTLDVASVLGVKLTFGGNDGD
jgi:predicted lipoprotein